MTKISRQLGKYFILVSMLSVAFITIISNVSVSIFFSDYLKESRNRDDLKVVQYVEQVYSDYGELNSQSLMSIMHYAFSEAVTVHIKDLKGTVVWSSGTPETMHSMMGVTNGKGDSFTYKNYPFRFKGKQVGSIDIGRPESIISSIEDKQFLSAINIIFAVAFLFSIVIAILSSRNISGKFLKPIIQVKENAKLIEEGKYAKLEDVNTQTFELHDLSVSIKELADRLEYQEAARRRMTSDIAHELRTPLATIQSHIEAFIDGVWEPVPEKLTIIHDEISRLTKLIKDLSDLSSVEYDKIRIQKKEVDLTSTVESIIESFEPLSISKNISLGKNIQSGVKMMGDPDRLSQIFINILSNAFKYTNENGSINVSLEQTNSLIRVIVEDTGIGIPKKDLKHVFERFYRSDLSRSRGTGGTGLGLTITKALVEAHGGNIRIESEEGRGTNVIVDFPE